MFSHIQFGTVYRADRISNGRLVRLGDLSGQRIEQGIPSVHVWDYELEPTEARSRKKGGYVFTQEWYEFPAFELSAISNDDWQRIMFAKDMVNKHIETARGEKIINANLSTDVSLYADGAVYESLAKLDEELRFVLITSNAELKPMSEAPTDSIVQVDEATETNTEEAVDLVVQVSAATGTKCVRCWHIRDDIGTDSAHPELCAR